MRIIFVTLAVVMLAGCANFTSPARTRAITDGSHWMDYTASRRGAVVLRQPEDGGRWIVCSEPVPDVALESVNKIQGDLSGTEVEVAEAKAELTLNAIQLAKRTQMVSYLRESLYRLCELSVSNDFDEEQTEKMYMAVVNAAQTIAKIELKEAEKAEQEAEAEAEKAKARNKMLQQGVPAEEIPKLLEQ